MKSGHTLVHSSSPGVRPWLLHVAGALTMIAWSFLARRSHEGGSPLPTMLAVSAIAWAMLGVAALATRGASSRAILGWGFAFRIVALFADPVLEEEHNRFLWDGYQFATTGNPYNAPPSSAFGDAHVPANFRAILDRINHADVPTIYGPVCQWAFRLAHAIAPAQLWPWKLILLGAEIAILGALWSQVPASGRLLLGWCPLAIFETGFNAHPDALAIAVLIIAWRFNQSRRFPAAGVAAGLAVATKGFAALLVPFLGREWSWRAWLIAAATTVSLYLPFWAQGSSADLTGLRAMAQEWEFNSSGFAIVQLVVQPATARAVCALVFGIVWLRLLRRWFSPSKNSTDSWPAGERIYGLFLLFSATANPWYFLWLWPFVALRTSAVGICALAAVALSYVTGLNLGQSGLGNFAHPWWLRPIEFGSIVATFGWCRLASGTRRQVGREK